MNDRFNTLAGWLLFSGIIALGLSSVTSRYFGADSHHRPDTMGYIPAGVAVDDPDAEAGPSFMQLLATADPVAGERVYAKCRSCHTVDEGGAEGLGPNLYAVVGAPIGGQSGSFGYSSAIAGHGGDWTFENLDAWLASPRGFADGTNMSFPGLPKVEDRANLVAYLNTMGSDLPLPEVVEEPAEEEVAVEGEEAPVEVATAE